MLLPKHPGLLSIFCQEIFHTNSHKLYSFIGFFINIYINIKFSHCGPIKFKEIQNKICFINL